MRAWRARPFRLGQSAYIYSGCLSVGLYDDTLGLTHPGIPITAARQGHTQRHQERTSCKLNNAIEVSYGTAGQHLVAMFTERNISAKMSALF